VPKVHDLQLRGGKSDYKVIGSVGDVVRVRLDENPTTGFVSIENSLKKESNSLNAKSLIPLEEHVV